MSDVTRGSFDNDDAAELLDELEGADVGLLVDTVSDAADISDVEPLEIPTAHRAIAAVEIVAACLDGRRDGLPDAAKQWIAATNPDVPNHLARKAGRALERVLRDSDLLEAWRDEPEFAAWSADIEALRARLPF